MSRSSRENYGDSAVGYVSVQRGGTNCTVQAKICPEHKVGQKDYSVKLFVDEESDTVENLECLDCPASAGKFLHLTILISFDFLTLFTT